MKKCTSRISRIVLFVLLGFVCFSIGIPGCPNEPLNTINLMPAPDVYRNGGIGSFPNQDPFARLPYSGMLYATDRMPAAQGEAEHYYSNDRGHLMRLGVAGIKLGDGQINWEEARRISMLKDRTEKFPLKVTGVEELGALERSHTILSPPDKKVADGQAPGDRFASYINQKLHASQQKDIFIYVHGYKVVFENPVLVAMELWHFLGYSGTFIAYAWPSTPSKLAYFADLETATASVRNFRVFLEYLAENTRADQIHIIGYSAGTRLVLKALQQLALMHHDETRRTIRKKLRIGNIVLVGSDIDPQVFTMHLADGILKLPSQLTVYMSEQDKALNMSKRLLGRKRLGQAWFKDHIDPAVLERLTADNVLSLINVTGAQGSATANGHRYLRKSPWVSSDILLTLKHNLKPAERGLKNSADDPVWSFPSDYTERLKSIPVKSNPEASDAPEHTPRPPGLS